MKPAAAIILTIAGIASMACGPTDPEKLYVDLGCPRCHGFHLEGNRYGPALDRLGNTWDSATTMSAYLRDPKTTIERNPRLKAQDAKYDLKMQPVTEASDEDLIVLSAWLLTSD